MLKNPIFYFAVLCVLILITGGALVYVESPKPETVTAQETVFKLQHPHWTDDIVLEEKNRIHRKQYMTEKATIIEQTDNALTLVWDKWGTETFVKQDNGVYLLQK